MRASDDPKAYRNEAADIIAELVRIGFDEFFLNTLARVGAGAFIQKSAQFGAKSVKRGIATLSRRALKSLTSEQLLEAANALEDMLSGPVKTKKKA